MNNPATLRSEHSWNVQIWHYINIKFRYFLYLNIGIVAECFHCTDNFQCSDNIQNPNDSFSIQLWTFYENSHLNIHTIFILNYESIIFECSAKHPWNVPWMLLCPLGTSGMGVRRCSLTILTYNIIFWSVIVQNATYGCKLLIIFDKPIALLEEFQEYAAKNIQRFYSRAKIWSFYTHGWAHLEHFIEIKKLFFIQNILSLEDNKPIKIVFWERAAVLFEYVDLWLNNINRGPVFDLLQTAISSGLTEPI